MKKLCCYCERKAVEICECCGASTCDKHIMDFGGRRYCVECTRLGKW